LDRGSVIFLQCETGFEDVLVCWRVRQHLATDRAHGTGNLAEMRSVVINCNRHWNQQYLMHTANGRV
jgi:hypothetical protein